MNIAIPLKDLFSHPDADCLEMLLRYPPLEREEENDAPHRLWLLVAEGSPTLSITGSDYAPVEVCETGGARWIDYGTSERLIAHHPPLEVRGCSAVHAHGAHLVVTDKTDLSLAGKTLEEAEVLLYGLRRADAGTSGISPARTPVGQPATFTVDYAAGAKGLAAGSLLRFTLPRMFSRPQTDDPAASGYLQVLRSDAQLALVSIDLSYMSHEKVDIVYRLQSDLAAFGVVRLQYHTDVAFLFTSRWEGERMPDWYSLVAPLTVSVSTGSVRTWIWLADGAGHSVAFTPGPAERLHLFLPGRRRADEPLHLRGTITDRYRNPPAFDQPLDFAYDLQLEDTAGNVMDLALDGSSLEAPHRFAIPLPDLEPGVYRACARKRETGEVIARSNPLEVLPAKDQETPRIYWGELHTHSEMSDGYGDFAELYRHARDQGAMDFVSAADHLMSFCETEWLHMQDIANRFDDPERFCALIGYEWQARCVYTSRRRLRSYREPTQSELAGLMTFYRGDPEVVLGPHAPLGHRLDWQHHDPGVQRFVEMSATWGVNDFRDNPRAPDWIGPDEGLTINDILRTGARLGFTGGGDIHCGRAGFSNEDPDRQGTMPHDQYYLHLYKDGMTGAVLNRLDRNALIQGIRNRQTYATTGARILLDFSVGQLAMGQEGRPGEHRCRAIVHAAAPLARLRIIRDGEVAYEQDETGLDAALDWLDPAPGDQPHYYYVDVRQQDSEMAWSSPVYTDAPA